MRLSENDENIQLLFRTNLHFCQQLASLHMGSQQAANYTSRKYDEVGVVAGRGRSKRASRAVEGVMHSVFCWLLRPWISLTVKSYNARYIHQYVHLFTTSITFTSHSCLTVRIPSARSALPCVSFTLLCVSVCFRNIHTTRPCDLRHHAHSAARSPVNHWPARRRHVVAVTVAPTVGISWNSKNRQTNCDRLYQNEILPTCRGVTVDVWSWLLTGPPRDLVWIRCHVVLLQFILLCSTTNSNAIKHCLITYF